MLTHVDWLYTSVDPEKLKDWRNILSGNKEFNYIPKTTQAENRGIHLQMDFMCIVGVEDSEILIQIQQNCE